MLNPAIARGVLRFLAKHQGLRTDRPAEEEPGKILHEMRSGELARLRQIPHTALLRRGRLNAAVPGAAGGADDLAMGPRLLPRAGTARARGVGLD